MSSNINAYYITKDEVISGIIKNNMPVYNQFNASLKIQVNPFSQKYSTGFNMAFILYSYVSCNDENMFHEEISTDRRICEIVS